MDLGSICSHRQSLLLAKSDQRSVVCFRLYTDMSTIVDPLPRVEYPVGVGFSPGKPTATTQEDIAMDFVHFFKNFQVCLCPSQYLHD